MMESKSTFAVKVIGSGEIAKKRLKKDVFRKSDESETVDSKRTMFRKAKLDLDKNLSARQRKRQALRQIKALKNKNFGTVSEMTALWEKLRPREVSDKEKQQWIQMAISRAKGKILDLVQNPKASRVLQWCLQYGNVDDRRIILSEMHQGLVQLSMSKYSKHLVQRLISKVSKDDFDILFRKFPPNVHRLLKHQYGSDVMNELYCRSDSRQKQELLLACYGREFVSDFEHAKSVEMVPEKDFASFEVVFKDADLVKKANALQKLHGLLSTVIEKGLLVNRLVHRLTLEFFQSAPPAQVEDLSISLAETGDGLLKMVHTKEGSAVASAIIQYSDANRRKIALRGFKDYVKETAFDSWGYVILIMAFRVVDDTKLLHKTFLTTMIENVEEICQHRYARLILLDLLHPDCRWYLPSKIGQHLKPRILEIHGKDGIRSVGLSKKDDTTRRKELLLDGNPSLANALIEECIKKAGEFLKCRRANDVLVEVARGGEGGLLESSDVQRVHDAIVAACLDRTMCTDRISKGALIRLIGYSKEKEERLSKRFCKAFWKNVVQGHCDAWMEGQKANVLAALMICGSKTVRKASNHEMTKILRGKSAEDWVTEKFENKRQKRQKAVQKRQNPSLYVL